MGICKECKKDKRFRINGVCRDCEIEEEYKCRMCGKEYIGGVNIKMKKVTICDECCDVVTKQHMMFLINKEVPRLKKCIMDQRKEYYGKGSQNVHKASKGDSQ